MCSSFPNTALESFRGLVMARVLDENKEPSFKTSGTRNNLTGRSLKSFPGSRQAKWFAITQFRHRRRNHCPCPHPRRGAKPNDAIYYPAELCHVRPGQAGAGSQVEGRLKKQASQWGDLNMIEVDGLNENLQKSATLRFLPYEECLSTLEKVNSLLSWALQDQARPPS